MNKDLVVNVVCGVVVSGTIYLVSKWMDKRRWESIQAQSLENAMIVDGLVKDAFPTEGLFKEYYEGA